MQIFSGTLSSTGAVSAGMPWRGLPRIELTGSFVGRVTIEERTTHEQQQPRMHHLDAEKHATSIVVARPVQWNELRGIEGAPVAANAPGELSIGVQHEPFREFRLKCAELKSGTINWRVSAAD